MTETSKIAQRPQNQINVVQFTEFTDSDDSDFEEVEALDTFPVISGKKPGWPAKKPAPYEKYPRLLQKEKQQEQDDDFREAVQQMINEDHQDEQMGEAPKEKKSRKSKTYDYDAGRDLLNRKMDITFEQGMQLSPTIKQQVIKSMKTVKPGFEVVEINNLQTNGDDDIPIKLAIYV